MPIGLERMKALRTLGTVGLNNPKVAEELGALAQLQTLEVKLYNSNEEVMITNLAGAFDKMNYLRSLYRSRHKDAELPPPPPDAASPWRSGEPWTNCPSGSIH
ncbi:hypothetical protein E2562_019567 [Oryza meyeriana var. granulata]|uniref:Uncharacterized protein n=1 Tax=Oryza meyeriana var. granulata TaxID=110450 RepID=A0A6G1BYS8_9ORYZ|nr:hypothetical protein E2562_019567 [Oryza meyeriana var. granulata]